MGHFVALRYHVLQTLINMPGLFKIFMPHSVIYIAYFVYQYAVLAVNLLLFQLATSNMKRMVCAYWTFNHISKVL
jgi:hypothetical protein